MSDEIPRPDEEEEAPPAEAAVEQEELPAEAIDAAWVALLRLGRRALGPLLMAWALFLAASLVLTTLVIKAAMLYAARTFPAEEIGAITSFFMAKPLVVLLPLLLALQTPFLVPLAALLRRPAEARPSLDETLDLFTARFWRTSGLALLTLLIVVAGLSLYLVPGVLLAFVLVPLLYEVATTPPGEGSDVAERVGGWLEVIWREKLLWGASASLVVFPYLLLDRLSEELLASLLVYAQFKDNMPVVRIVQVVALEMTLSLVILVCWTATLEPLSRKLPGPRRPRRIQARAEGSGSGSGEGS